MISRRSSTYCSMIRRASSMCEGFGFGASFPGRGSSDGVMPHGVISWEHPLTYVNVRPGRGAH